MFPPRISLREKRRRQLALSIKRLMTVAASYRSAWTLLSSLLLSSNELDHTFLSTDTKKVPRRPLAILKQEISRSLSSRKDVRVEGHVCICTGRRSWIEEWAEVSSSGFVIPQPQSDRHQRCAHYSLLVIDLLLELTLYLRQRCCVWKLFLRNLHHLKVLSS